MPRKSRKKPKPKRPTRSSRSRELVKSVHSLSRRFKAPPVKVLPRKRKTPPEKTTVEYLEEWGRDSEEPP